MSTIEVVVYGSPSIHTIKRLGYMRENGRSSYVQLWPTVAIWYGQSCVRVKAVVDSDFSKQMITQRVRSVVSLGKLSKISTVKVFVNGIQTIKYKSLVDFDRDSDKGQWSVVLDRLKEVEQ